MESKKMKDRELKIEVTVFVTSSISGKEITKKYTVTDDDIDDIEWVGGSTGDCFFDEMEGDEERFLARLEDTIHGLMWDDEDEHLGGADEEFVGYHEQIKFDHRFIECDIADFIRNAL